MKPTYLIIALSAVLLTACPSTPPAGTKLPDVEDRTGASNSANRAGTGANASGTGTSSLNPTAIAPPTNVVGTVTGRGDPALRDPNSLLSRRNIFFDYDGFVVSPEYRSLIEAHAAYLARNKDARVRIEGNTDERGSREYNLALGQRRADAVRRALTLLGVSETQIETVSFGEEKPRMQGTTEEAWRDNRRADLFYPGD